MKKIVLFLLSLAICVSCMTGCDLHHSRKVPKEGLWYCQEALVWMDFTTDENTYATVGETKVKCTILNDRGSSYVCVLFQDEMVEMPGYEMGASIFEGDCILLTSDYLLIKDDDGNSFHFSRIE